VFFLLTYIVTEGEELSHSFTSNQFASFRFNLIIVANNFHIRQILKKKKSKHLSLLDKNPKACFLTKWGRELDV
jgi:hypothetical protein